MFREHNGIAFLFRRIYRRPHTSSVLVSHASHPDHIYTPSAAAIGSFQQVFSINIELLTQTSFSFQRRNEITPLASHVRWSVRYFLQLCRSSWGRAHHEVGRKERQDIMKVKEAASSTVPLFVETE
jgi:hypothetical protein